MICGSRDFVSRIPPDLPRIEVSGMPVPYVETAENLGVTLDSKFTWKPQVEAVTKKVNHALYSLNFFRHLTTFELRKRLVSALALSHLLLNRILQHIRRPKTSTPEMRDEQVTPARRQLGWLTTDMPLGY